jgi:hypothetical protein
VLSAITSDVSVRPAAFWFGRLYESEFAGTQGVAGPSVGDAAKFHNIRFAKIKHWEVGFIDVSHSCKGCQSTDGSSPTKLHRRIATLGVMGAIALGGSVLRFGEVARQAEPVAKLGK